MCAIFSSLVDCLPFFSNNDTNFFLDAGLSKLGRSSPVECKLSRCYFGACGSGGLSGARMPKSARKTSPPGAYRASSLTRVFSRNLPLSSTTRAWTVRACAPIQALALIICANRLFMFMPLCLSLFSKYGQVRFSPRSARPTPPCTRGFVALASAPASSILVTVLASGFWALHLE